MRATMRWILIAVSLCAPLPAAGRSLVVDRFHAMIEISPDGTIRVEERIVVEFEGSWNGIFRHIPYGYTYPSGVRDTIRLFVDAVEDETGQPLEYWQSRSDGNVELKIRVPGAQDAVRTVIIRYHAQNVIRRQDGDASYGLHDELYWNVTGSRWQMPIREASAEVVLPVEIPAKEVQATAFTGPYGSTGGDFELHRLGGGRLLFETGPLPLGAGLTIAVGFPQGYVEHPSARTRARWFVAQNWFVGLPVAWLGLAFGMWWYFGRDSLRGKTIIPDWEAPMGLRPSQIGVVVDDRMDRRDLTAGIFDLAVRGIVKIRDRERGDFELELQKPLEELADLEPFERRLLDALFRSSASKKADGRKRQVRLADLRGEFYTAIPEIYRLVHESLVSHGIFDRTPMRARLLAMLTGIAIVLSGVVVGIVFGPTLPYWLTWLVCSIAILWLAWQMPQRTRRGLEALARVRGMEEYLETAERERMEKLPLAEIEKLLPYAIALDLHDRWAAAFGGLFERAPSWYACSDQAWSAHHLVLGADALGRSVRQDLFAVPRSLENSFGSGSGWGGGFSGGSGFSGGGFSGGGAGGGGGGGW